MGSEMCIRDSLDLSCFDGRYVTGTVTEEYLAWVEGTQES